MVCSLSKMPPTPKRCHKIRVESGLAMQAKLYWRSVYGKTPECAVKIIGAAVTRRPVQFRPLEESNAAAKCLGLGNGENALVRPDNPPHGDGPVRRIIRPRGPRLVDRMIISQHILNAACRVPHRPDTPEGPRVAQFEAGAKSYVGIGNLVFKRRLVVLINVMPALVGQTGVLIDRASSPERACSMLVI